MIARGDHFVHVRGAAPAFLREGQIHTVANDLDVGQLARFFVEPFRFEIANRRVQRRDRSNYSRLPSTACQSIVAHVGALLHFKVGRGLADFRFITQQSQRGVFKLYGSHSAPSRRNLIPSTARNPFNTSQTTIKSQEKSFGFLPSCRWIRDIASAGAIHRLFVTSSECSSGV